MCRLLDDQVPLFVKEGLLPMDPASCNNAEFSVPGVGNVAKGDMWEYFVKGSPMQSDSMLMCLQFLAEASKSGTTYLVNTVEELEPQVLDALKKPLPFTGEVCTRRIHPITLSLLLTRF